jgi:hypothetical protein
MRKNDLIKKLQTIKGNPDVMLWNGFVEDFVPIGSIGTSVIVKQTKSDWMMHVKWAEGRTDDYTPEYRKELEDSYRKISYEHNSLVDQEDFKNGRYKKKTIAYIDAKMIGKSLSDRQGLMQY